MYPAELFSLRYVKGVIGRGVIDRAIIGEGGVIDRVRY